VTRLRDGRPGIRFLARAGNFSLRRRVQTASGAHSAAYSMGATPGVKRPGREADQSLPYSSEVKNPWRSTSTPSYVFMVWCLISTRIRLHGVVLS
jgi:hypothetical protein